MKLCQDTQINSDFCTGLYSLLNCEDLEHLVPTCYDFEDGLLENPNMFTVVQFLYDCLSKITVQQGLAE